MKKNIALHQNNAVGKRIVPNNKLTAQIFKNLTNNKPKCLMEINNVPILKIWIDKLAQIGCSEILINTHYLSEQVTKFIESYNTNSIKILISHEMTLLGTAGTLIKNIDFINGDTIFMHSDNFTTCDLNGLLEMHKNKAKNCLLTMLTFDTDKPSSCGVVETDQNGILKGFYEKVDNPPSKIANGAIFIFEPSIFQIIKKINRTEIDISKDLIPILIGKINSYFNNTFLLDI